VLEVKQQLLCRFSLQQLLAALFASGLFLLTRLLNLIRPGLNYDEATYLYWGKVIGQDWNWRYMGASYGGKQPLHSWLVMLAERLIADADVGVTATGTSGQTAWGDYVYSGGGWNGVYVTPKTYRFDGTTWDDGAVADMGFERYLAATDFLNGRWITAGGAQQGGG
jgi:hypothetical protein